MVAWIPVVFAIAGVLAYALSSNAKIAEIGRLVFFAGVLVTLFALSGYQLRLLP